MKINDKVTLSIAAAVSDVLEGRVKKEESKYPHDMFHPKTGEKVVAKTEKDHEELSKKGYTHDKPEVDEVAEPVAKGEKDFKAKHKIKKSGEKEDGTVVKENREWAKLDDRKKEQIRAKYQDMSKLRSRLLDAQDEADDDGDEDKVDAIMDKLEKVDQAQKDLVAKFGRGVVTKRSSASEGYEKDEDEKEVKKEGNKFTMALNAARKNGDDTFVVSGKKYKVEDYDDKDDDKEEVDEAVQSVTKIKFDYKNALVNGPKTSADVAGIKSDWNIERMAVRSAIKPLGGIVTDSEAPSKSNKFVGTLFIGTRGDASKLSTSAIQKAVKSKGAEIQSSQFESVAYVEEGKFPKSLVKKATELALKMGGDMTGASKKIEKMKKGLSDDPEVKAALQLANEEVTESVVQEAHEMNEAEDKKAKYKAFFDKALKKFGVDSPAELKGDKKKEFFDYVDANYEAENETD